MVWFRTIDLNSHPIAQFEENRIIREKMLNSSKVNKLWILTLIKQKQCPGSGLSVQHILAQLGTPSHCFYAQLWGTQCRSGLRKGWAKIIRAIFQLDHDQLTSSLLSHLFWIFQSTFKLQLMILAAITTLWAFLNCFLLFLAIFLIKELRNEEGKNILQSI